MAQNEPFNRRDQAASPRVGERFRLPTHGGEPEEHIEWDPTGLMYRIVPSSESSDLGREAWTPRLVGAGGKGGGLRGPSGS